MKNVHKYLQRYDDDTQVKKLIPLLVEFKILYDYKEDLDDTQSLNPYRIEFSIYDDMPCFEE